MIGWPLEFFSRLISLIRFFALCTFLGLILFLAVQTFLGDAGLLAIGRTLRDSTTFDYQGHPGLSNSKLYLGFTTRHTKKKLGSSTDVDGNFGNRTRTAVNAVLPVAVRFEVDSYTVDEGATTSVRVVLSRAPERSLTIPLTTSRQRGVSFDDYSGVPGSISFDASETESAFTFSATQDHIDDDGEGLRISFGSSLPTGVTIASPMQTIVHIGDDDVAGVTVSPEVLEILEGANSSYTVVLDSQPTHNVTITINSPQRSEIVTLQPRLTFTPNNWNMSQSVKVFANPDRDKVNDTGAITHSIDSLDGNYERATPGDVSVTVIDDDVTAVTVSFAQSSYSVAEGSTTSVEVVLSADPQRTVTVPISATAEGGATTTDYLGVPDSVTFDSGDTRAAFTVSAASDEVDDDGESVKLRFGTLPSGVSAGTVDETTILIADDDLPAVTVSFKESLYSVQEGRGVSVKLELSAAPEQPVTIPITRTDRGGATSTDYYGVPDSVVFGASDTETSFTFSATQDSLNDDGESVKLTFGDLPDRVTAGLRSEAAVSIVDDDDPSVTVSFKHSVYTVAEGATTSIKVSLSADPERTVTIRLVRSAQSGISLDDYSGVPERIALGSGETDHTFVFTATDDYVDDDGEGLLLSFGSPLPSGVNAGTPGQTTVRVTDDDMAGVTIVPSTLRVEERATTSYMVVLDSQPTHDVTITINSPTGAKLVTDKPRLIFTPSDWHIPQKVTITANPDSDAEDYEGKIMHSIDSSDGKYERLTPGQVEVTVIDNDVPSVTVSFGQATYSVLEGATTSVTISLSADPERSVTILLAKSPQGGIGLGDYSGVPESIVFDPGETERSFTFMATGDRIDDDDEALRFTFGSPLPPRVTAGTPSHATVRIVDDDKLGVTVKPVVLRVEERATTSYTVVLDSKPTHDVTITINSPLGAKLVTDKPRLTFTSKNWRIPQRVTVTANPDNDTDDYEGMIGHTVVSSDSKYGRFTQDRVTVTVIVIDNDVPSVTVSFGQASYSVGEGSTTTVKVVLDKDPERAVTIPIVTTTQGGATSTDYSGVPESVHFNPGETEITITFVAAQDSVDDDGESVKLSFGVLPEAVTKGTANEATVSIEDDDVPSVTVSFGQAAYSVAEGATTTVRVYLNSDPERTITIPIISAHLSGATSADYAGVPNEVVFDSGETEKFFTFTAVQDSLDDDDEAVRLTLGPTLPTDVTTIGQGQATVFLVDDDTASVAVQPTALTIAERATSTYTVMLESQPTHDVTLHVLAPVGTRISTDKAQLIFATSTWDLPQTVTVTAGADDDTVDDEGTITHTIVTIDENYGGIVPRTVEVKVVDDDVPSITVTFGMATYRVEEGNDVTVDVMLSADPERTLVIPFEKTHQKGVSNADYTGVPDSVTFNPGDTVTSFTVSTIEDSLDDDFELVKLSFVDLPEGVSVGTYKETAISILDDEVPSVAVTFGRGAYTVLEGDQVTIAIALSDDPERTVTIPIERSNRGGATTRDYTGVPRSISFDRGETEKHFTFVANQDSLVEGNEGVELSLRDLPDGVTKGVFGDTTVAIADDDVEPVKVTFVQSAYEVMEGNQVTIRVRLSDDPQRTLRIPIVHTSRNGATGTDYSGVPRSLTFKPGDTEKSFTLSAVQDTRDEEYEVVELSFGPLPAGVSTGRISHSTVTITDPEATLPAISFEHGMYTVAEGNTKTIVISLSEPAEAAVSVLIETLLEHGATSTDFLGVPAIVTFERGETERSFAFNAIDDGEIEDWESIRIRFGDLPETIALGTYLEATVLITDAVPASVAVSFEQSVYTVVEGSTTTVKVVLDRKTEYRLSIPIVVSRSSTSRDVQRSVIGTVTFGRGAKEGSLEISSGHFSAYGSGSSLSLAFGILPANVIVGAVATSTIWLADVTSPEGIASTFGHPTYVMIEGNSVTIRMVLSVPPVEGVTGFLSWIDSDCLPSGPFPGLPAVVAPGAVQDGVGLTIGEAEHELHEHWERICNRLVDSAMGNYIRSHSKTRDYAMERRTAVDLHSVELLIHHCIAARRTMCAIAGNISVVGSMVSRDRIRWLIENLTGRAQYVFTIELDKEDLRS